MITKKPKLYIYNDGCFNQARRWIEKFSVHTENELESGTRGEFIAEFPTLERARYNARKMGYTPIVVKGAKQKLPLLNELYNDNPTAKKIIDKLNGDASPYDVIEDLALKIIQNKINY